MKIAYCLNSIRCLGGIQNVTIHKMNALAEIPGNEVYAIVTDNWSYHLLVHPLSPKVHFIKLGVDYYAPGHISNFNFAKKRIKHALELQNIVSKIKPDILISVGQGEKYIVPLLKTNAVKIREVHFNSDYRYYYYNKYLAKVINFLDYKLFSWGYNKVVLLTKEDKETHFAKNDKFMFMHNPLTFRIDEEENQKRYNRQKIVISVGRLELQKDYLSLVRIWYLVHQKVKDWNLVILGEGSQRASLTQEIEKLKLNDSVSLPGFSKDVRQQMCSSSIFALTSRYEGFGLVITEAMSCGLPVVSLNFSFGPKDIITEDKDGFVIENRNEQEMANRIVELIENEERRRKMSEAAYKKAKMFSIDVIIQKWMNLFHQELEKQNK